VTDRVFNVLFLCTGNSARSILAESLLNQVGYGRFRAYSAGSHPKGEVHPLALETLRSLDFPIDGLRSKSWDEFERPDAPTMDFIFTVCDNAAGEACPYWHGHPMTAHWGVPDPAAVDGSTTDKEKAFWSAFRTLESRIKLFACLPIAKLEGMRLRRRLAEIGKAGDDAPD